MAPRKLGFSTAAQMPRFVCSTENDVEHDLSRHVECDLASLAPRHGDDQYITTVRDGQTVVHLTRTYSATRAGQNTAPAEAPQLEHATWKWQS
jgi:hypothetical protein